MRKKTVSLLKLGVALALAAWASAWASPWATAEFKMAPMDEEFVGGKNGPFGSVFCPFTPDVKFDKLPEDAKGDVKGGRFALDGVHPVAFAAYQSGGGQNLNTLVFDLKGDGDLTNDEKITGLSPSQEKPVTLNLPGGGKFDGKIRLTPNYMLVQTSQWLKGTVELDGKKMAAALVDQRGQGFDLSKPGSAMMLLDLNGNGRFDVDYRMLDFSEMIALQPEVSIHGKLYALSLDAGKPDVALKPYDGPQGKLAVNLKFEKRPEKYAVTLYTTTGNDMRMLSASQSDFPVAIKAGEAKVATGMMMLTGDSGKVTMVQFSMDKPIVIEAGKTTTVAVGDHEALELTLEQKGAKLSVSPVLASKNGVKYGRIMAMPGKDKMQSFEAQGPEAKILDEKGKVLAEGAMEYG